CILPGAIDTRLAYRSRALAVGVVVVNNHTIGVLGRNAPHERTFCCITLAGAAKDDTSTSGIVALGTCMVYRFERLGKPVWVVSKIYDHSWLIRDDFHASRHRGIERRFLCVLQR